MRAVLRPSKVDPRRGHPSRPRLLCSHALLEVSEVGLRHSARALALARVRASRTQRGTEWGLKLDAVHRCVRSMPVHGSESDRAVGVYLFNSVPQARKRRDIGSGRTGLLRRGSPCLTRRQDARARPRTSEVGPRTGANLSEFAPPAEEFGELRRQKSRPAVAGVSLDARRNRGRLPRARARLLEHQLSHSCTQSR